eukprot:scaffold1277_cov253-Pinguiococcus_pyrenoidosus.AAC.45
MSNESGFGCLPRGLMKPGSALNSLVRSTSRTYSTPGWSIAAKLQDELGPLAQHVLQVGQLHGVGPVRAPRHQTLCSPCEEAARLPHGLCKIALHIGARTLRRAGGELLHRFLRERAELLPEERLELGERRAAEALEHRGELRAAFVVLRDVLRTRLAALDDLHALISELRRGDRVVLQQRVHDADPGVQHADRGGLRTPSGDDRVQVDGVGFAALCRPRQLDAAVARRADRRGGRRRRGGRAQIAAESGTEDLRDHVDGLGIWGRRGAEDDVQVKVRREGLARVLGRAGERLLELPGDESVNVRAHRRLGTSRHEDHEGVGLGVLHLRDGGQALLERPLEHPLLGVATDHVQVAQAPHQARRSWPRQTEREAERGDFRRLRIAGIQHGKQDVLLPARNKGDSRRVFLRSLAGYVPQFIATPTSVSSAFAASPSGPPDARRSPWRCRR